jgi:hypothetical protein
VISRDPLPALTPVVETLERLGVVYYIGGSIASSAHGSPRSTNDVDLVADLQAHHVKPFDRLELERRRESRLSRDDGARPFAVASPEDTVLRKLMWFRESGEALSQQWRDVQDVLAVQDRDMDVAYLHRWAPNLGVADLLERALEEARAAS